MRIARFVVQLVLGLLLCHGIALTIGFTAYVVITGIAFVGVLATLWHVYWGWWLARDIAAAVALATFWPILALAFGAYLLRAGHLAALQAVRAPLTGPEPILPSLEDSEQGERRDQA